MGDATSQLWPIVTGQALGLHIDEPFKLMLTSLNHDQLGMKLLSKIKMGHLGNT